MSLAVVVIIAVSIGAVAGTHIRVPRWVPAVALVVALSAIALGFMLGYEDDTAGGGRGFGIGWMSGGVILLVALATWTAGLIRRRS